MKRILICLFCLVLVIGCTVRIVTLNQKYPNPTVERYCINENFEKSGFSIIVKGHRLLTVPEIKEYITDFDVSYADKQGNDKDESILLVELEATNLSKEENYFPFAACTLRSGSYMQGLGMRIYPYFTEGMDDVYGVGIKPGQTVRFYLPYHLYSIHFSDEDWRNLDSRTFEIVFSLYPVKQVVTLK